VGTIGVAAGWRYVLLAAEGEVLASVGLITGDAPHRGAGAPEAPVYGCSALGGGSAPPKIDLPISFKWSDKVCGGGAGS